jgi:uncharacterized protein YkwD
VIPNPYYAPKLNKSTKLRYLNIINEVRSHARSCGSVGYFSSAPALRWSEALYRAAYEHSNDMKKSHYFNHKGSNSLHDWTAKVQHLKRGSSFKDRIENNGYKAWKHIAENIEGGSSTVEAAVSHWLQADRHCANIMNPIFTDVGMAHVENRGSQISHFWTQTFAAHQ